MRKASEKTIGGMIAKRGAAQLAAIDWLSPVKEFRLAEERVGTRLGLGDIEFEFETPLRGPFAHSDLVSRLLIPAHLLRGVGADAKAVDIAACDSGFTFRLQDTVFHYHRYGLERI